MSQIVESPIRIASTKISRALHAGGDLAADTVPTADALHASGDLAVDAVPNAPGASSGHDASLETVSAIETPGASAASGDLASDLGASEESSDSETEETEDEDKEAAEEEEAEQDELSDVSDDFDLFDISVLAGKSFTTVEDIEHMQVMAVAAELRDHPLLPPDPCDANLDFLVVDSGVALPPAHCAFRGCPRVFASEEELRKHVLFEHLDNFDLHVFAWEQKGGGTQR